MSNLSISTPVFANGRVTFGILAGPTPVETFDLQITFPAAEIQASPDALTVTQPSAWTVIANLGTSELRLGGYTSSGALASATLATVSLLLKDPEDRSLPITFSGEYTNTAQQAFTVASTSVTLATASPTPPGSGPNPGPANAAPVAASGTWSTPQNVPVMSALTATDADSTGLTFSLVTPPVHGAVTLNPAGGFIYTPSTQFSGTDSFSFRASDGLTTSNTATASITVTSAPVVREANPADDARRVPVSSDITLTFNEPVQATAGGIRLKTADGKLVETFSAANTVYAGNSLTLNPKADLGVFTRYVLEVDAGAVRDATGNANTSASSLVFQTASLDGLYHFFVVAFAAAPGLTYLGQLAEAYNHFNSLPARASDGAGALQQIVEIFTTKSQFTSVYPATLSNRELATQLVDRVVKNSATAQARQQGIDDIQAALDIGWSRGKVIYTVFGNLASKPLDDPVWGNTARQFQNQLAVARYFTEEQAVASENLVTLQAVLSSVTANSDVASPEKIVQIIGTPPPGG
jgi:methionine-rich copper-binding protein CopC